MSDYNVRDPVGATIPSEVVYMNPIPISLVCSYFQLIPISNSTLHIPGRTSSAQKQIIFKASLPSLGFNTYYFEKKR